MKWVIWCLPLLLLLSGCCQQETAVCRVAETEIRRLERELDAADGVHFALQENLARWYNVNLRKQGNGDFRGAYDTILYYTDGVMGSLEIPEQSFHQPIYHGLDGEKGVGHDPDTAFPIGEAGNHPVLITKEPLTLESGDVFVIHILGSSLLYRVTAVRDRCDTSAVPDVDYCSLITGEGKQLLAIRVEEETETGFMLP